MYNVRSIQSRAHRPSNDVAINFRVDEKLRERLKQYCEEHDLGQSALLRELVAAYLGKVGGLSND